ncbi:MAG: sulfur oxidation c-type cytochrome SoxX [Usitatibacteraceae bacterium]
MRRTSAAIALLGLAACAGSGTAAHSDLPTAAYGSTPPSAARGDVARGREVVTGRDGNCLLCHAIPETGARFSGNLGPVLSGIGARATPDELRQRLMDPQRFNPQSIMPAYARIDGLTQVGKAWQGKPILSPQQIEDTVAFLATLR